MPNADICNMYPIQTFLIALIPIEGLVDVPFIVRLLFQRILRGIWILVLILLILVFLLLLLVIIVIVDVRLLINLRIVIDLGIIRGASLAHHTGLLRWRRIGRARVRHVGVCVGVGGVAARFYLGAVVVSLLCLDGVEFCDIGQSLRIMCLGGPHC